MTDDELHTLRAVYGRALEAAAERFHAGAEAFRARLDPTHQTVPWAALDTNERNAIRAAIAATLDAGVAGRLVAAALILDGRP